MDAGFLSVGDGNVSGGGISVTVPSHLISFQFINLQLEDSPSPPLDKPLLSCTSRRK